MDDRQFRQDVALAVFAAGVLVAVTVSAGFGLAHAVLGVAKWIGGM